MKSFAIWYDEMETKNNENEVDKKEKEYEFKENKQENIEENNNKEENKRNNKNDNKVDVDLHFNLWKLKPNKKSNKQFKLINLNDNGVSFLDIGIKVKNIKNIKQIYMFVPFKFKFSDFEDLGIKMKDNRRLINGIFNDDCQIIHNSSKNSITIERDVNGEPDLIKIYTLDSEFQNNIELQEKSEGTIVVINTERDTCDDRESSYYRFRIQGEAVIKFQEIITSKDLIFKTSYETSYIIDFRVNEKRSIPENLNMLLQKKDNFNIKAIHFLLLMDRDYKLGCTGLKYSMRGLEDNLWEEYLGSEFNTKSLVGYHWKKKAENDKKTIKDFNSYIRIEETKSNIKTMMLYLLGVLAVTMTTNLAGKVFEKLPSIVCPIITVLIWMVLILWVFFRKKH